MSHEEIAIGLGIARGTLEKHYESELSVGAYERRMEVIEAMHDAASKGSVTAQRAYLDRQPYVAAPPVDGADEKPAEAPPKGKKERADADAKTAHAGTKWEVLLGGKRPR